MYNKERNQNPFCTSIYLYFVSYNYLGNSTTFYYLILTSNLKINMFSFFKKLKDKMVSFVHLHFNENNTSLIEVSELMQNTHTTILLYINNEEYFSNLLIVDILYI